MTPSAAGMALLISGSFVYMDRLRVLLPDLNVVRRPVHTMYLPGAFREACELLLKHLRRDLLCSFNRIRLFGDRCDRDPRQQFASSAHDDICMPLSMPGRKWTLTGRLHFRNAPRSSWLFTAPGGGQNQVGDLLRMRDE